MGEYKKPIPVPSPETQRFWEGTKKHEMWIQQCQDCNSYYFYPRSFCPKCFSWNTEWKQVEPKGQIHAFAIQFRPAGPGFVDDVPYVTALVELECGVRLMTNIVDVGVDLSNPPNIKKGDPVGVGPLKVGAPVEVAWEDVSDEITLPKFKLAS